MNKRQKKKRANWWRKDLYKWCRRHPCESKEILCRIEELRKEQENEMAKENDIQNKEKEIL